MASDRELVGEIADRYLPDDVAARWLRLLRPAAVLRHAGPGARVAAVLGGEPGLPDWAEWPMWEDHGPLSFIAAIDCAALAAVPLDITLPGAVLSFRPPATFRFLRGLVCLAWCARGLGASAGVPLAAARLLVRNGGAGDRDDAHEGVQAEEVSRVGGE